MREGPGHRVVVDDRQAIDRDAGLQRVVTRLGDLAPGIVGAVATHIDEVARRGEPALGQKLDTAIDPGADRGAPPEGAWRGGQPGGKGLGGRLVADHRPVNDGLHFEAAGELHIGDADRTGRTALDGAEYDLAGEGGRITLFLQGELAVVDAARHVGDQDERHVHVLRRMGGRRNQERREEQGYDPTHWRNPDGCGSLSWNAAPASRQRKSARAVARRALWRDR